MEWWGWTHRTISYQSLQHIWPYTEVTGKFSKCRRLPVVIHVWRYTNGWSNVNCKPLHILSMFTLIYDLWWTLTCKRNNRSHLPAEGCLIKFKGRPTSPSWQIMIFTLWCLIFKWPLTSTWRESMIQQGEVMFKVQLRSTFWCITFFKSVNRVWPLHDSK